MNDLAGELLEALDGYFERYEGVLQIRKEEGEPIVHLHADKKMPGITALYMATLAITQCYGILLSEFEFEDADGFEKRFCNTLKEAMEEVRNEKV